MKNKFKTFILDITWQTEKFQVECSQNQETGQYAGCVKKDHHHVITVFSGFRQLELNVKDVVDFALTSLRELDS